MRHRIGLTFLLLLLGGMSLPGCEQTTTVDRQGFQQVYDDQQTYTDIWYTGTDDKYHHFVMEHWTVQSDGKDGHLDYRKLYQVPKDQMQMPKEMAVTADQEKWVLIRPT